MVHQVEAGEQADARGAAGRALAEVIAEEHAVPSQRIEVRSLHDRVANGAKAIAAPLIGADEENVGVGSTYHGRPHVGCSSLEFRNARMGLRFSCTSSCRTRAEHPILDLDRHAEPTNEGDPRPACSK
jgi:hypothetical protein